jgi:hypothetical protein
VTAIDLPQRPQGLAVHLLLPHTSDQLRREAFVGWTGMASASSLAMLNSGEQGAETLEMDPQYAQALGFSQDDLVYPHFGSEYEGGLKPCLGGNRLTS